MNQIRRLFGAPVYVRQGPPPECPEHGPLTVMLGGCDWPVALPSYVDRWGIVRQGYVPCGYRPTDNRPAEVESAGHECEGNNGAT